MSDEKLQSQIQSLSPSAFMEFFTLDLTPDEDIEENRYRFHASTNGLMADVTWQAKVYAAWALEVTGFDKQAGGTFPRVRVKLGNRGSAITLLALNFDDMLGARLTRTRTFAKYLDAVNFPGGLNADADPTVELPPDIFYLERKVNENRIAVELEFVSEFDVAGIKLPRRSINPYVCAWCYRSTECGYVGIPVANDVGTAVPVTPNDAIAPFDEWTTGSSHVVGDVVWYLDSRRVFTCISNNTGQKPTNPTYWFEDKCGGLLSDCKLRPREGDVYPFGGFPGAQRVPDL